MNAHDLRFAYDKALFDKLMEQEKIAKLAKIRLENCHTQAYRRDLLGRSLRINEKLAPKLYGFIRHAQEKMELGDKHIEAYIYSDDDPNASCYYRGDNDIILNFSSGILKSMDDGELQFVVGHELGHAKFEHYALPSKGILDQGSLKAASAMELMEWSRAAELSADRAGLYCSPNPQDAINSFLKLSCGLAAPIIQFDLEEYSAQIRDLAQLSQNLDDTSHCYSSHPFNPIRVMAVDLYAKSDEFAELCGMPEAKASERIAIAEVDKEIEAALMYMKPLAGEEKKQVLNTALFYGGMWVSLADGEYEKEERANLVEQVGEELFDKLEAELKPYMDSHMDKAFSFLEEQLKEAVKPLLEANASERCTYLQRLVVVARADGEVEDEELKVLHQIAKLLTIDPSFIQQILMFLE